MQPYTQTNCSSTRIQNAIEGAVGGSIFALRERECQLFDEDPQSPVALGLALIRGEFQRLLDGRPVRIEVMERAVQPSPANSPEGAESDLATESEAVGVGGA